MVQVALPSEPTQASHVGAVRGFTSRFPASPTSDQGSNLGCVTTSRISGGAGLVEISTSGSGEGPGWATAPGYSTAAFRQPAADNPHSVNFPKHQIPPPSWLEASILPRMPCLRPVRWRASAHGYSRGPNQVPRSALQRSLVNLSVEIERPLAEILLERWRCTGGRRLGQSRR